MDTKKDYLNIVNGPSAMSIYLNFMLWEELTAGKNVFDLEFDLEDGREMIVSRIMSIEHEDGSGTSFNITAETTIVDGLGKVRAIDTQKEFYYSAKTRKGVVNIDGLKNALLFLEDFDESDDGDDKEINTGFNPS